MTWKDLADAQQASAKHLWASKDPTFERAVCGRAYYAAYALVTSHLSVTTQFGRGWNNPPHAKLPAYVGNIGGSKKVLAERSGGHYDDCDSEEKMRIIDQQLRSIEIRLARACVTPAKYLRS